LGEVPITSLDRLYGGESTFQAGPWIVEYAKWFVWGASQLCAQKARPDLVIRIPGRARSILKLSKTR